ncbi:prephenate dehydrogenase [Firmicutes bacterium CAG:475]|nr:prephenate dehydrogenase [Firmicutes bacterium CAG:475]
MKLNKDMKILIVGLGLIGGSYAEALSKKGYEVGAIDQKQEAIDFALHKGYIASGKTSVDKDYVGKFDIVVFALYPHAFVEWIEKYQNCLKSGAIVTDVTGVKGGVVCDVQNALRKDVEFIAAHPMAGRECSGVENAKAEIFEGANYIVVPTERNTQEAIELCKDLGRELGFKHISELSVKQHDETVGFLSHLTHCIAVSLMVCKESGHLADYTGDSFRDLTRIAKINDEMWSELFLLNKDEIVEQMNLFEQHFGKLKECIQNDDREGIREMMRLSTKRRKVFDKCNEEN